MSFWNTSDNQQATETDGNVDNGGGNLEPIPGNTLLRAMVSEAGFDEYEGDQYIKLRWDVVDGEYKGRVIFHKLRVFDSDPKKADKAKRMLAAIAYNAGGKLLEIAEPTDADLQLHLVNKPMLIKVQVWEIETDSGETKRGNWVSAVESGKQASAPARKSSAGTAPPKF